MPLNMPKVSVIIPVYNAEDFIDSCLMSVFEQDYKNLEVIVVDDGSIDASQEKIKSYGDKIKFEYQVNSGAPKARNLGLSIATGKYVKFLDSDDVLEKNIISRQVEKMEGLSERDIVYGDYY